MNEKMLALVQGNAAKYPSYLEAYFPHVFNRLMEVWGTAAAEAYFNELMLSQRANRAGFPPEATAEIWTLHQVYSVTRASAAEGADMWDVGSDDAHHSRLQHAARKEGDGGK